MNSYTHYVTVFYVGMQLYDENLHGNGEDHFMFMCVVSVKHFSHEVLYCIAEFGTAKYIPPINQ